MHFVDIAALRLPSSAINGGVRSVTRFLTWNVHALIKMNKQGIEWNLTEIKVLLHS